jgi:hypothetical protein
MQDCKAEIALGELTTAFRDFIRDYPQLEVGRRINPIDAFALWRTLLRRNPDPAIELPTLLSYSRTYRELLTELADSAEFKKAQPILPGGYVWMAEVDGFRFWFNTGDREMGVLMGTGNYEPQVRELMKTIIRPGMRCIDAGASTGYYTCLLGDSRRPGRKGSRVRAHARKLPHAQQECGGKQSWRGCRNVPVGVLQQLPANRGDSISEHVHRQE